MKRSIAILAALIIVPWSNAMAQQEPTHIDNRLLLKYEPQLAERLAVALAADRDAPSEYWIGLEVAVPEDSQREKIKLPKDLPADQGLIVQQVVPDAPGDTAGIKVGDLLMKLGDKPLKSLSDPLDAIRDAKDFEAVAHLRPRRQDLRGHGEADKCPDGFGLHGPEPKNEVAKLDWLPAKPTFAPSANLQKIRAELAEIQQRIAIINRQLAELQTSQANPDREKIIRQIVALKLRRGRVGGSGQD